MKDLFGQNLENQEPKRSIERIDLDPSHSSIPLWRAFNLKYAA
jgi:hypothetical protein